jgi:VWFA-related protein
MPEGREDVLALLSRAVGRNLVDRTNDAMSDWEAYRIANVEGTSEARLDSAGLSAGATEAPASGAGTPAAIRGNVPAPGTNLTERLVARWLELRRCDPLALHVCRSDVRAKAREIDTRRLNRTRDVLAAIDRAVFALTGMPGRKSLLLLTEGFLNDPVVSEMREVAGRCREANIAVYSLDVRGLLTGLNDETMVAPTPNIAEQAVMQTEHLDFASAGNEGLAEETGGLAVKSTNDLGGGAVRIADESRTYYLLGYAPPGGKGPRDWRKLRVEVKRAGLEVRARRGYTLRTRAEIAAAGAPARAPRGGEGAAPIVPPDITRALLRPEGQSDLPVRALAYSLEERPGGLVAVALAVEADLSSLANLGGVDRPRGALSLSIVATHRDTGFAARVDQLITVDAGLGTGWEGSLALHRELLLPPGIVQARVVVRDEFLGRLGATTVRFEVPPPGGLRLSTPVLTDRLRRGPAGEPARPVMRARRDFVTGADLYCFFQVFGAAARVGGALESSVLLRASDGRTILEEAPSSMAIGTDGRRVRVVRLPLRGLAPGTYELVVRVEDKASGRSVERAEPLRVTRAGS